SYARLGPIFSDRARRRRADLSGVIAALAEKAVPPGGAPVLAISGASGAHAATAAEKKAMDALPTIAPRAFSSVIAHLKEAQFLFAIALAALAVHNRTPYPAFDAETEKPFGGDTGAVLATTVGYHQFEGVARVLAAD